MKSIIRAIVLLSLMVIAVVMAALTLADFRPEPQATGILVLGSFDERVAVFDSGDLRNPLQITEIDLNTLRSGDRALIEAGMTVASREELMLLLEDLGS